MSRKPHTPKAVELPRADPAPEPAPEPTCLGCRHWKRQGWWRAEDKIACGLCVADPPSLIREPTAVGPLCCYPVTLDRTPACGRFDPKSV